MLNHIVLMCRLTRDPELRRTTTDTPVSSFTLAVDRDYSKNDETVDFIDIVAWRQTAEFVQRYFKKGRMAVVEGRLQIREWNDKYETSGEAQRLWQTKYTSVTAKKARIHARSKTKAFPKQTTMTTFPK